MEEAQLAPPAQVKEGQLAPPAQEAERWKEGSQAGRPGGGRRGMQEGRAEREVGREGPDPRSGGGGRTLMMGGGCKGSANKPQAARTPITSHHVSV